ncbi:NUDIX hydrolase [Arthrobacter alpinus]|uniref:NUDIX hydrolase n=1 Tax=Arthrobacter alpinus TaxID=656366 RepID=A0A0S2M3U4_9MICC|nr:NUDIX hydrolase [Arthrobacter alpinus]
MAGYDPQDYPSVALTVDLVVFAVVNKVLHVALVERGAQPFLGSWALPGGFVGTAEDALSAAHRELVEETGLDLGTHRVFVEQLATFSEPQRDPRMRVVSVAHLVLLAGDGARLVELRAGTDASDAQWLPVHELDRTSLAFDHAEILAAGLERLAGKMEYTTIAAELVPEEFTLSALRDIYTAVWQSELPAGNFTRKMRASLTPTGRKVQAVGAPASLFTVASEWISPPWSRPRAGV